VSVVLRHRRAKRAPLASLRTTNDVTLDRQARHAQQKTELNMGARLLMLLTASLLLLGQSSRLRPTTGSTGFGQVQAGQPSQADRLNDVVRNTMHTLNATPTAPVDLVAINNLVRALYQALLQIEKHSGRLDLQSQQMKELAQELLEICEFSPERCSLVFGKISTLKLRISKQSTMFAYVEGCRQLQKKRCPSIWKRLCCS
jgi:intracellular sulfur oxidation DsrE/DsrF family protein